MTDTVSVRVRGLEDALRGIQASERQIERAARNAGSQTATAVRKESIRLIRAGTKLEAKVIRDRIGVHRTKPDRFKRDGVAAIITPRGPRRGAVSIQEYKPKAVAPQSPKYRKNRTRRAVLAKLYVNEPEQIIDSYFINPVHNKEKVWRTRSNGQHVPVVNGPPIYVQVERIQPKLEQFADQQYKDRFLVSLTRQVNRNTRR